MCTWWQKNIVSTLKEVFELVKLWIYNVLECLIFIEYSFGYLNDFIFFCSVKPEHYLNTMDFLQAIRETQEKMWWTRVWTYSYNKSLWSSKV